MQKGLGRDVLSNVPKPMSADVRDCEGNGLQQVGSLCAVSKQHQQMPLLEQECWVGGRWSDCRGALLPFLAVTPSSHQRFLSSDWFSKMPAPFWDPLKANVSSAVQKLSLPKQFSMPYTGLQAFTRPFAYSRRTAAAGEIQLFTYVCILPPSHLFLFLIYTVLLRHLHQTPSS